MKPNWLPGNQQRLLAAAIAFILIASLALSLSPAAREQSWQVDFRWSHWIGITGWAAFVIYLHRRLARSLPDADPYIFPAAALLTGWGLLSIWRLTPDFGIRQTAWMVVCALVIEGSLRYQRWPAFLRRYKYLWLTAGLTLTAATFLFGINPGNLGPRLWLGCCGIYLQPSEPLKLLLITYLAAYFAARIPLQSRFLPLILPTLFITGLALGILVAQRDLGTASIFIFLYAIMIYLASGYRRVLLFSLGGLAVISVAGYAFIEIIQVRINSWLNPWEDPSGRSYQIIQSLMAIANGGLFGRGPGLGLPGLVPVAHSDFIFTSIVEESGLLGSIALLVTLALLITRGFLIAIQATNNYDRLLAAGISAYFGIQSIIIIGGNLRALPLTGVTLPFVSYGGSSLLTSYIGLALLLLISHNNKTGEPRRLKNPTPYLVVPALLQIGLLGLAIVHGWWAMARNTDLLNRTDNARRAIADTYVRRGSLLDRNNRPITSSIQGADGYRREYLVAALGPVAGYTHPIYGQSGLEAGLDNYLRGEDGNPALLVWWNRLLYGHPPPGLDVRLTIDLSLQEQADSLLGDYSGAIVIMNANTGEVLAMASHPTFDPNQLDEIASNLDAQGDISLLNRATQGQYAFWRASQPFRQAAGTGPLTAPDQTATRALFESLGLFSTPDIPLAHSPGGENPNLLNQTASPLQMAIAAAALSNGGFIPAPVFASAVNTPQSGWVILNSPVAQAGPAIAAGQISTTLPEYQIPGTAMWGFTTPTNISPEQTSGAVIFLGGSMPGSTEAPRVVVAVLEQGDTTNLNQLLNAATRIGVSLLGGSP